MRRLEAVRVIQWYHFQDEILPVGGNCLLLGDNGSGKTTILDAIQLVLVADLGEVLLNRAANEKSRRTLHGYVRWKIGSEDESRPGAVRYGRGACTSYVMLEFRDSEHPGANFICGIGFEANETDTDIARLHFVVPNARVTDIEATGSDNGNEQKLVRPLREFRVWIRTHGGRYWQDSGTYREELRQRLGVLPELFHRLLAKALAFKPIGQVRQFVFDYLLDERRIDTIALQSNLEHYKRLEGEAKEAEKRIQELKEIVREGERISTERRTAESHHYMQLRADSELAKRNVVAIEGKLAETRALLGGLLLQRDALRDELESVAREWERVIGLLEGHEVYRQLKDLERQLEDSERRLVEAETAERDARSILAIQSQALKPLLSEEARLLRRIRPSLFERNDLVGAEQPPERVTRLQRTLASEGELAGRDLAGWQDQLGNAADCLRNIRLALQKELESARMEGKALQEEQETVETGRQRYPDGPAALLHLLSARLKGRREARPLCELIEIPNARWRDAVEGYLNTRRFDVLVAPEDYPRALALYERHKRDYPLPGQGRVFISSVGLVDIERMMRVAPRCEPRSLAEQVETNDPYARAYCDFVLGDVICVDDEQSLRNYKAAITDTVMVYRNHVARQTARDIFARHYIGEAARQRRLKEIADRLGELHEQVVMAATQINWVDKAIEAVDEAKAEVRRLPDLLSRANAATWLKAQVKRLSEQKSRIDRSEIQSLEQLRDDLGRKRGIVDQKRELTVGEIGKKEQEVEQLQNTLRFAVEGVSKADGALLEFSDSIELATRTGYEERYQRERVERSPTEIHDVFERQQRMIESRVNNLIQSFIALKGRYVERRGLAATVEGEGYEDFAVQLEVWQESRLPAYLAKISEAKTKALQQLAEDVVFRLRENLLLVRRQIDELNKALREVIFGSERYQFTVEVDPEHRDFYDLVMDAGRFEKESLFGAAALVSPELKETLGGLLDRLVEAEAKEVKTELEARADYREYFRYDLKILHADGHYSLYDKVSGDKSGGETQTPYYIAILASMCRLYRSRSLDGRPICGIVLLDEAFGKMDESRIAATLTFSRNLGLQLVLATPKERSEMVAPWVERSLLIHKDPISGMPTILDFTKEFVPNERAESIPPSGVAFKTAASS